MVESKWHYYQIFLSNLYDLIGDNPVHIQQNAHAGVRASDFVGRTQGKLRDFYRIGKVLGTGEYFSFDLSCFRMMSQWNLVTNQSLL